jgi:hypothetical protein
VTYIGGEQVFGGHVKQVTSLSFIWPRKKRGQKILASPPSLGGYAIFLDGEHEYQAFQYVDNSVWSGVIVPNISIELDLSSAFDDYGQRVGGCITRSGSKLCLNASIRSGQYGFDDCEKVTLIDQLENSNLEVHFSRWRILRQVSNDNRVELFSVDRSADPGA